MSSVETKNHTNGTADSKTSEVANGAANSKATQLPEWLNVELFNDFLKAKLPGFKEIKSFKAKPALAPGENYSTIMVRIEMDIIMQSDKQKQLSYMMKIPVEGMRAIMQKSNFFDLESTMYLTIVPEMEQLYRDAGVEVKFGAEYYNIQTPSEFGVILLEDLRQRGFKNVNRLEGLDMEHTKCVLRKLAQWHAASAVRVQTKGAYMEAMTVGFFKEEHAEAMKQIQEGLANAFINSAKTFKGNEEYLPSLIKYNEKYFENLFKAGKFDTNEFNVLNHGDCWSNNVMFQYDAFGKIRDTYIIDFQIPKYGTPAQDLYYFLFSSTNYDLKLKQFDYFIKFYHDNLVENLTLLKYPKQIPKLKDLHILLHKHNIWAYVTTIGVMAAVLLDPTDKADIEGIIGESEAGADFRNQLFSSSRYKKHAEALLPWLYNRGVFES